MKTIRRKLDDIGGIDLIKIEKLKLRGGLEDAGTCGYYHELETQMAPSGWFGMSVCGISMAAAQASYSLGRNGWWCCDSCPTTFYCSSGAGTYFWEVGGA
jgi:hypothetical protein